jgi:hypothetical protein
MKRLFSFLVASALLIACNTKPKNAVIVSDDGKTKVSIDPTAIKESGEEMQKKIEELKKLPPLTVDQLKAMLPEELSGIKRSSFSANSSMGVSLGEANYKKDDTTNLRLVIYDCAGEAGSAFYSMNFFMKMNMESQDDNGYTKTTDFMGQKAMETYKKYNDHYTITYLANDHLMVTLEGEHTGLDAVKQAAQSLNLK